LQAASGHADVKYLNFDLALDYVKAIRGASAQELTFNTKGDTKSYNAAALPWAWAATAGYAFDTACLPSHLALSYQQSHKALAFRTPRDRWLGEYKVTIGRATDLALQVYHDHDYRYTDSATWSKNTVSGNHAATTVHGTSTNATDVVLNLGVKFA
jgi:hypothetical protein